MGILGFISVNVWKTVFGERADSLERSTEHEDECTISLSLLFTHTKQERGRAEAQIVSVGSERGLVVLCVWRVNERREREREREVYG